MPRPNLVVEIKHAMKDLQKLDTKFQACAICGTKNPKRGLTFHHLWYEFPDVRHYDYPKNKTGRLQYLRDLRAVVHANPNRFELLCSKHHFVVESALRYSDNYWEKLCMFREAKKPQEQST